jgi:uncharacterized protein YdiU (UPF0061 family)
MPVALDDSFARELVGLHQPWRAEPVADPSLVVLNEELASELGLDVEALRSPAGVSILAGNDAPAGVTTVAQAYAGHQFGGYSPRLGDGRALLLGEIVGDEGSRLDLHLKGSGRTPFARGGDGRAALGPMLREYVIGEAMHALGIPTTRALAVTSTGETILREVDGRVTDVPGAVLARVASSHLRVGTFQFASATGDGELLQKLTDYAIARHAPDAAGADNPALALFDHVVAVQASLVAQWMSIGFIHGVMNTDNTTISGETIDYGPCAFMDAYDPATVFSSIDQGGRYAYGNQPAITTWNLARLAEAMLPLFDDDTDTAIQSATEVLQTFPERFQSAWSAIMHSKLGLDAEAPGGDDVIGDLLALMAEQRVDYTACLRALSSVVCGDAEPSRSMFAEPGAFDAWTVRWLALVGDERDAIADRMDRVNPIYIPRNHIVEEVLTAASWGDHDALTALLDVVTHPFDLRPGLERFARPAPDASAYRTFCGT